jgi:hypothetical protein
LLLTEWLTLHGQAPLAAHWRLVRNGKLAETSIGMSFRHLVVEPGNYRAEAWLDVAGEQMLWILSNPLYIAPAGQP